MKCILDLAAHDIVIVKVAGSTCDMLYEIGASVCSKSIH